MNIQPLADRVLVEPMEIQEVKKGGIIIPDTAKEKPHFAKVLALSGIEDPEISVGDVVFFKSFSGTELEFNGKEYMMMPYADILGKVVDTEEI
jgi:chaperonin GroES